MFKFIISTLAISLTFFIIQPKMAYSQRKIKVVKVKTKTGKKRSSEDFGIKKQGKAQKGKVTKNGRRLSNRKETIESVKKTKKRNRQLKKRRKNPNAKYNAGANPKTKDAKKFNKKGEIAYKTQRKKERNSAKSRKATIKFNKKLSRQ